MAVRPAQRCYNHEVAESKNLFDKNAYVFSYGGAIFVQKNNILWTMQEVEWRQGDSYDWHKAVAGCSFVLTDKPVQILINGKNAIQVTQDGWKEVPFLPVATMIAKIAEVVDYIEVDANNVYALLEDSRPYLGCKEVINRLLIGNAVEQVGKTLYRLVKENINPRMFLDFDREVTLAYERIVKE